MTPEGKVDFDALKRLTRWQIEQGTHGLVPVGTTGESPTLTDEEHLESVRVVVEEANGAVPVIAGCGSNNTVESLHYHRYAKEIGADGALHVTGYYNKPSQEGLYRHFAALAELNDLPIIVYNIPPRAIVDITPDTMARIATLPSVVGVKDATGDLNRPLKESLRIDGAFDFLSGEDGTAVAYNAAGGRGCISVTANVAPALCADMQNACLAGDFPAAMAIQKRLMPLHEALFLEPSPAGVKYAASRLGLCTPTVRLPIVEASAEARAAIDSAMDALSLPRIG